MTTALPDDPIDEARRRWLDGEWPDDALTMATVSSIMRVRQILASRADEVLRPFNLTFSRFEALMLLSFARDGSMLLGRIGERLLVSPANVTGTIDRLEARGWVRRVPHESDGRSTLAQIMPAGREMVATATPLLNERVLRPLGLTSEELEQLYGLLRKVRRAAGDFA